MKRFLTVLMTLVFGMVAVYAKPTLDGNKILLDEAATSLFTAEQFIFITKVVNEIALNGPDEIGDANKMRLELFCNPNKTIEFKNEETAEQCYLMVTAADLQPEDLYVQVTGHYENLDFWLFMALSRECTTPGCTSTYCYIGE